MGREHVETQQVERRHVPDAQRSKELGPAPGGRRGGTEDDDRHECRDDALSDPHASLASGLVPGGRFRASSRRSHAAGPRACRRSASWVGASSRDHGTEVSVNRPP